MLRIYVPQHGFNLSDPAGEEGVYASQAMCRFVGIDLGHEPVPDETTVCRFRHLLETHGLGRRLFDEVWRNKGAERALPPGGAKRLRAWLEATRPRVPVETGAMTMSGDFRGRSNRATRSRCR